MQKFKMINSFVNNVSVDGSKLQNVYAIDLRLIWLKKEEKPILCSNTRVGMLIHKSFLFNAMTNSLLEVLIAKHKRIHINKICKM